MNVGARLLVAVNLIILACELDALFIEPFNLQTTAMTLHAPALFTEGESRPLRIVHLTDLHIERTTQRERLLIEKVQALQPDLILLTGDYLNLSYLTDPRAIQDAREILGQLHATHGVYAVSGTVDFPETLEATFNGLEIALLQDKVQHLSLPQGDLYLIGVANWERERDRAALQRLAKDVPPGAYSIVLYHTPDLVETAAGLGLSLELAGHTHGGQIRLPLYGAVFTGSAYGKAYEAGLYAVGATHLYVSRGIGMEGSGAPRARFLCPPEIVLIELIP